MILDHFRFAFESIRKRKLRSYLTMLGIFIGIAAVVSLISLAQGMQSAIESQFASFGTDTITIQAGGINGFGPPGTGAVNALKDHDVDVIKRVRGVDKVFPRLIRSVKLEFDDEVVYGFAASVPDNQEDIDLVTKLNGYKIAQGRFLKQGDSNKIILGDDFASRNRFEKNPVIRSNILIEGTKFEVIGILERKGNPQQDSTVVVPEDSLRDVVDDQEDIDVIIAKVIKGEKPSKVSTNIEDAMRRDRNLDKGKEDFQVQTTEQTIQSVGDILAIVQGVLIGIAAISILVGGVGIMNTMYTSVVERTKEIGVMKAVGARRKDILSLFLIESGMLGATGGAIGVIIGIGLSKLVEVIATVQLGTGLLKAEISFWLVFGALMFSFIIGALSGILPALQASKLKPVEALRK